MHFITVLPVSKSVTHTVYDIAAEMPDYSGQITLIDTVFLKQDMRRLLPLTAMYAPNSDWDNKLIKLEDISKVILENHLIENLAWCEDLVALAGTKIDTLNGQLWGVTVNEAGFPCFDTKIPGGEAYKSCIVECDILARNGLVHLLDKVMLFDGRLVGHYAKTNHKEYFAEGTESYFYRNDFYPFVRAELKKHDPDLHAVLEKVWGKL